METQVRTPQLVFMQPQRLIVPLFQRPYVWTEEAQWEPLWSDVARTAERVLEKPSVRPPAHFLGAVVLQQVQNAVGGMQARIIIDGQQRLTTLQLLMDALHGQLHDLGARQPAQRLETLVRNAEAFCSVPEDQYKVWPTNRDRPAFNAVMSAPVPVDYASLPFNGERMQDAHQYFSGVTRDWLLLKGNEQLPDRAAALETTVRDLLQLVVIDLTADENAQEIFETLNARGAQLTAADLIKNFIFQRMMERGADVEPLYERYWKEFETAFWEAEVSAGRTRTPRASLFLNHWLTARTGEEVVAREVFSRFKRYADAESGVPMTELIQHVAAAAKVYRQFVDLASLKSGQMSSLGLFGYRTGVLESEVVKPLVLCLLDPQEGPIPGRQLEKALSAVESWMVRRMLVRATTKSYSQVVAELVKQLREGSRTNAGDIVEGVLARQSGSGKYWPDDAELSEELQDLLAYRRIGRGRLRMVLEAIEDHKRGWFGGNQGLGGERVSRSSLAIEHVMPRKWAASWPLDGSAQAEHERERLIHTFGNLTLLTGRLNSKVSNGPWAGPGGKREGLEKHDVLLLNREILKSTAGIWDESLIVARTRNLIATILQIWPVPLGHKSGYTSEKPRRQRAIKISDLIAAGAIEPGSLLIPRRKAQSSRTGSVLSDGRIELEGKVFDSPSLAAVELTGSPTNGWWYFYVDPQSKRTLKDVRREYLESLHPEAEDDDADDGGDDE